MKVTVKSRSGRELAQLELAAGATVDELKQALAKKIHCNPNRQRLTTQDGTALKTNGPLSSVGVGDGAVLLFKDLGMQIGYRMVFVIEYLGPLIFFAAPYLFPGLFYSEPRKETYLVQRLGFYLSVSHFVKRELETLLVHRFSNATMPVLFCLRNSSYYYVLSLAAAYYLHHPKYTPYWSESVTVLLAAAQVVCMAGNLVCHIKLSKLRPTGTTRYGLPRGFLFEYVSCPNYTFEITQWVLFAVMTQVFYAYLFILAGGSIMVHWAIMKHRRYRKTFDGKEGRPAYPKSRKILVPFVF